MRRSAPLLALATLACQGPPERCDLVALTRLAAPAGAEDCGRGDVDGNDEVNACLVAAFRDGRPFQGIVERSSTTRRLLLTSWVGGEDGVITLAADFTTCNSEDCLGTVMRTPCESPEVVEVDGAEQLACRPDTPPCPELVCGEGSVLCDSPEG